MVTTPLAEALRKAGLAAHTEALLALARPTLNATWKKSSLSKLSLGSARLGGLPDVWSDFEWPLFQGKPLGFIAQIDCAALPAPTVPALPRAGSLLFFYDLVHNGWGFRPEDRGSCRVLYTPVETDKLKRAKAPPALAKQNTLPCHSLHFTQALCLPHPADMVFEFQAPELTDEDRERYENFVAFGDPVTRLGGHPEPFQEDPRYDCELTSHGLDTGNPENFDAQEASRLRPYAWQWQLLLQVGGGEKQGPGLPWDGTGALYFMVKDKALAALDFRDAWLVLQCT